MSPGRNEFPVGQRGYWADVKTFVLEDGEIANLEAFMLQMRFDGNRVVLEGKERMHESGVIFKGRIQ